MKKITMYSTYAYENDTKLEYTVGNNTSRIELTHYYGDFDCAPDTLVCSGYKTESMITLAGSLLTQITEFLDETNNGNYRPDEIEREYPDLADLNNSALIAFELMLQALTGITPTNKYGTSLNKNGHECGIMTIESASKLIAEKFIKNTVKAVYIAIVYDSDKDLDPDNQEEWHKIVPLDLPFDNLDEEIALLMGYCGGGNVALAYSYDDNDRGVFDIEVRDMITESTGLTIDDKVYVEFIGINDDHSYAGDNKDK